MAGSKRSASRRLLGILFLGIASLLLGILSENNVCHGMPTPDEESFSREYAKELTGWLAALGPPLPPASPCQHYNNLAAAAAPPPPTYLVPLDKRNSELINSLLTLPKQLNEVGK